MKPTTATYRYHELGPRGIVDGNIGRRRIRIEYKFKNLSNFDATREWRRAIRDNESGVLRTCI